ncbi:hypothetical protein Neosp_000712 [[Neocosmospora] mangrovei]
MNQVSTASTCAGKFWEYSTNFKPEPIAYDFLSAFLGLAKAFADGVLQGETAELVASLRSVPFGCAFVTGGPVSNLSVPQDPPFYEEKVNDKRYDDDGSSVSDDDEDYIRPEGGYSLPVTEQNVQQGDDANDEWDAGSSSPDSELHVEEQYEPLGSEFGDSDSDGEPFVRSPGWTQHTPNTQGAGRVQTARVAWAALQNKLVDDATRRAQLTCPNKVVVRVLPWKVELINLRRVEDTTPKMTDLTTVPRASPASRAMVMHTNSVRMNSFRNKSPASVFGSLSEFARSMAEKDLETWELV